jgi:hypothetical protein
VLTTTNAGQTAVNDENLARSATYSFVGMLDTTLEVGNFAHGINLGSSVVDEMRR